MIHRVTLNALHVKLDGRNLELKRFDGFCFAAPIVNMHQSIIYMHAFGFCFYSGICD